MSVRDLDIIHRELCLKDRERCSKILEDLDRHSKRGKSK